MKKFTLLSHTFLFILSVTISSCFKNKIETDSTLRKGDKAFIQSLNLLEKDEKILKFYSEYKTRVAGNFYTSKRLAKYWIDENNKYKNKIDFAYYPDIVAIDTDYYAGLTYCPYMLIKKKDNTQFKVCVEGNQQQIKAFFEDAMKLWKQNSGSK